MRKRAYVIVIAIVIIGIVALFFNKLRDKNEIYVITSGIVEGTEVNITSKSPGRISEICCAEGDRVEKEQTVVKLESNDLNAAVEQAVAGVESARAEVLIAEASIKSAGAELKSMEAEIQSSEAGVNKAKVLMEESMREKERAEALYREELQSKESYERLMTSYEASAAEYRAAEARLASSKTGMTSAKARLDIALSRRDASESRLNEAAANLSYHMSKLNDAEILSPLAGTVVFKAFEAGETVSPGITILTVVDLDNLYVRVDIDETRIGEVSLNKEAKITLEGIPDKVIKGAVSEIGRYAEFATQRDVVRGRQDIRTFRVKITVDNHGGILKPGMTVTVTIPG